MVERVEDEEEVVSVVVKDVVVVTIDVVVPASNPNLDWNCKY